MQLDELIQSRRSIRKYKKEVPDAKLIEQMVRSASFAPSPSNTQPVRFFNLTSHEIKERLHQAMVEGRDQLFNEIETKGISKRIRNIIKYYWRYSEFMFSAPIIIAVGTVANNESFSKRLNEAGIIRDCLKDDTDLDITIGMALKGFMLKAQAFGLGTCILTAPLTFIPNVDEILGVENVTIKCFVTAGFSDEAPNGFERKNIEDILKEI